MTGLGISASSTTISSSGQERKKVEGFVDGRDGIKRSKSGDSQTDVAKVDMDVEEQVPDTGNVHSVEEAEADRLAGQESKSYGDRIHYCIVFSPAAGHCTHIGPLESFQRRYAMPSGVTSRFTRMERFFIGTFLKAISLSQKLPQSATTS